MPLLRLPPRANKFLAPVFAGWLTLSGAPAQSTAPAPTATPSRDSGKKIFEEWSILVLEGKRCGYESTVTTETETGAGPEYHTIDAQEFVIKRMNADLRMMDTSEVTEDAGGGVLRFSEVVEGAGSRIESNGVREGDDLVVTSRGQTARYTVPRLSALGPEAVRRLTLAVPLRGGQTFSFDTFESDHPQGAVAEQGTVVGQETRRVQGVDRSVWKLSSDTSLLPGLSSTSWVDDRGNDVESIMTLPGIGPLDEIVANRAECMKQPEGAEIFATALLHPQRALADPHALARATYRLTSRGGTRELPLWNGEEQRVLSSKPGAAEIEVTDSRINPAQITWRLPHADTPDLHSYLQASAYLEVNSPEIQALARKAVGEEKNPVVAAHRIERFVRRYITKKDLNIGFASAEETAKSREGDCTEHAVLCAAIGRAAGLPTRCVLGFGYIPPGVDEPTISNAVDKDTGIFGFHMWAEAWVGPHQWVPMDAALNGFDVGHIAIVKTALEEVDPLADLNMPILEMMENLKITIVKTVPKTAALDQGVD